VEAQPRFGRAAASWYDVLEGLHIRAFSDCLDSKGYYEALWFVAIMGHVFDVPW
jgi:hypothetical protein